MSRASRRILEQRRQRLSAILPVLERTYPDAKCSLDFSNPLELLVATILSAQCTDERVNLVTADLFRKYRSAADYARASQEQMEHDIQSIGLFRNKSRSLRMMGQVLVERHGGAVPDTMEELVELPGVGRKTANVVLGNAFHKDEGIVVDTHVARLANRLGLTSHANDATRIEQDLLQIVPRHRWTLLPHQLIQHGRTVCRAVNPACDECPLRQWCPSAGSFGKARGVAPRRRGSRRRSSGSR